MTPLDERGRITEDRHGRKAPAVPTVLGPVLTVQLAASRRVIVARWDGRRHRIYRDGQEVPEPPHSNGETWKPWW